MKPYRLFALSIWVILFSGCSIYQSSARKYLEGQNYRALVAGASVGGEIANCRPLSEGDIEKTSLTSDTSIEYEPNLQQYFVCTKP